jgi:hypothetical protein
MGTFDEELAAEFDTPPPPRPPTPTAEEAGADFSIVTGADDPAARSNDQVRRAIGSLLHSSTAPRTQRQPPFV